MMKDMSFSFQLAFATPNKAKNIEKKAIAAAKTAGKNPARVLAAMRSSANRTRLHFQLVREHWGDGMGILSGPAKGHTGNPGTCKACAVKPWPMRRLRRSYGPNSSTA